MEHEQLEADIHEHVSWTRTKHSQATSAKESFPPENNSSLEEAIVNPETPRMQTVWAVASSKELEVPIKYRNVAVLIVRWADHLDKDLNCGKEVEELNDLFSKGFNFKSSVLVLDDTRRPQLQLRHGLDQLVLKNDGPCRSTLLIVYYTGHGVGGDQGLHITGTTSTTPDMPYRAPCFEPHANWNDAERSLIEADADVLTILDCCCASSIWPKGGPQDDRSWEVLAASMRKEPTAAPGPRSFSRALITALKARLEKVPDDVFTAYELHWEIQERRKNERSVFRPRYGSKAHRWIKIARFPERPESVQLDNVMPPCETASLTLRLSFENRFDLQHEQVERLAQEISRGAANAALGVIRIDWMDFQKSYQLEHMSDFVLLLRGVMKVQRLWRSHLARMRLKQDGQCADAKHTQSQNGDCRLVGEFGSLRRKETLPSPPPSPRPQ